MGTSISQELKECCTDRGVDEFEAVKLSTPENGGTIITNDLKSIENNPKARDRERDESLEPLRTDIAKYTEPDATENKLKGKDKEAPEQKKPEKEQKKEEPNTKETKDKELKEKELKENEIKAKELKEKEEKELKDKELQEKELKEKQNKELKDKEQKDKELKDKELKEQKERELKEKETREKELREKEIKEKEEDNPRVMDNSYSVLSVYDNLNDISVYDFSKINWNTLKFDTLNEIFPKAMIYNDSVHSSHSHFFPIRAWEEYQRRLVEKAGNGYMIDTAFPPENKSIVGSRTLTKPSDNQKLQEYFKYTFKRLPDLVPGMKVLHDDLSVQPNDINQGFLGDCYFLGSLAATAAERPDRLTRCIFQRSESKCGYYCIWLCITGAWKPILIDDHIPVRPDGAIPFTSTKNKVTWAMLYEKAFAKAYEGYWHIGRGGQTNHALHDITGAPTIHLDLKKPEDEEKCLRTLLGSTKKGYIMTASTKEAESGVIEEENSATGLVSGHAYTLLGAFKTPDGVPLVKLRNPWGKGEWKGDWSDKSPKWTKDLIKQFNVTDEDNGMFYMSYEDLRKHFVAVTICEYNDGLIYSSCQFKEPNSDYCIMRFEIEREGRYYVGVSQPDTKHFFMAANYELAFISCFICKTEGLETNEEFSYVDEFSGKERDPWIELRLTPGVYWAILFFKWKFDRKEFTFWTYGAGMSNAKIKNYQDNERKAIDIIKRTAYYESKRAPAECWTPLYKDDERFKAARSFELNKMNAVKGINNRNSNTAYSVTLYENNVKGLKADIGITGNKMVNCRTLYPEKNLQSCSMSLPCATQDLFICQYTNLPSQFSFSQSIQVEYRE